jgi:hypothetical protein
MRAAILLPLLLLGLTGASSPPAAVTVITVEYERSLAGAYDLGLQIGRQAGPQIRSVIASPDPELAVLLNFTTNQSGQGPALLASLVNDSRAAFPFYYEEIMGMAAGADVDSVALLVNNFREELVQFVPLVGAATADDRQGGGVEAPAAPVVDRRVGQCSTIFINSDATLSLGHNDDWTQDWRVTSYFVLAAERLPNATSAHLRWGTWVYPGYLPGNDLSFNSNGVVYSINSLFPRYYLPGGVGTAFVARDLLSSSDLADAQARAAHLGVSSAMSYNLGSWREQRLLELEVDTNGGPAHSACAEVAAGITMFHGNQFVVLPNASQFPDKSTAERSRRFEALLPLTTFDDARLLLGDTEGGSCRLVSA